MRLSLCLAALAALFGGCDARVNTAPPGETTTIVNPPAAEKTVETNTTVVNPPATEKKVESTTTTTTE